MWLRSSITRTLHWFQDGGCVVPGARVPQPHFPRCVSGKESFYSFQKHLKRGSCKGTEREWEGLKTRCRSQFLDGFSPHQIPPTLFILFPFIECSSKSTNTGKLGLWGHHWATMGHQLSGLALQIKCKRSRAPGKINLSAMSVNYITAKLQSVSFWSLKTLWWCQRKAV